MKYIRNTKTYRTEMKTTAHTKVLPGLQWGWLDVINNTLVINFFFQRDKVMEDVCITVNNFVDWLCSGAVMHYTRHVKLWDGTMSILLSSPQEAVACVWCIKKECHCCERQLFASGRNWKCRNVSSGKMSSSVKN